MPGTISADKFLDESAAPTSAGAFLDEAPPAMETPSMQPVLEVGPSGGGQRWDTGPAGGVPLGQAPAFKVPVAPRTDVPAATEVMNALSALERTASWLRENDRAPEAAQVDQQRLDLAKSAGMEVFDRPHGAKFERMEGATAAGKVGAGLYNIGTGFVEGLTDPNMMALMAVGGAGPAAAKAVAGTFAVDMARHVPAQAAAGASALDHGDLQAAVEGLGGAAASALMARTAYRHAAGITAKTLAADAAARKLAAEIESDVRSTAGHPLEAMMDRGVRRVFGAPEAKVREMVTAEEFLSSEPAPSAPPPTRRAPIGPTPEPAPPRLPGRPPATRPAPEAAPLEPALTTELVPGEKVVAVEFPLSQITLDNELLPQFKLDANERTGEVRGEELKGAKYERPSNPVVIWQLKDGRNILVTGRHRYGLAKRLGEETIPATIVREADGFTRDQAMTLDAEFNIRDGNGSTEDYVRYFENTPISQPEAAARGLLDRAKGKAAWDLAHAATDDLKALRRAGKIDEREALAIARTAPGDAGAQAVGIRYALEGRKPDFIVNVMREAKASAGPSAEPLELFGRDDSAMREMEARAARATAAQRELRDQISAVSGAAKRPEVARKLGVDVADPAAVQAKLVELRAELERWDNWPNHPDLLARVRGEAHPPAAEPPKAPEPAAEPVFDAPESVADQAARMEREAAVARSKAEAEEIARRSEKPMQGTTGDLGQGDLLDPNRGDLFSPPPPRQSAGTRAHPGQLGPGGELGAERPPVEPKDNPGFSLFEAMPVELPEAVRFARDLLGGTYPRVVEKLRALGGRALGVFRYTQGPGGKGAIEMRADVADLLTKAEKEALRIEAEDYAKATAESGDNLREIVDERYEWLLKQAYEQARERNPLMALKVMWHEIGHLVDWLPEKVIEGRGNLFGRIASLRDHTKHTLPVDPSRPAGQPMTAADHAKLVKEAQRLLRDELGPIREIVRTITVEEPELRIAGITPEDVKGLFGMAAREQMPELYRWFAEQPVEVKKEVIRKAMKGLVDERLAKFGKAEQVGTRRVTKTVRERVGREPTREEIQSRFRALLRQEMERRNISDLKTVKAELEPLIAWWRGTEKMEDYFRPSPEMYAEAYSVFLNNPAAVAARAPTYYRMMHGYMDRKPAVKALYGEIQDQIKSGRVMGERVRELRSSWVRDDANSMASIRERLKTSTRDVLDNVVYHFDRRFGPIYRAARGYAREGELREAIGSYLYRQTEHERFLGRMNRDVGMGLVRENLDWVDLAEYMFHSRVANERFNIFNPQGWTSKNSIERLAEMRRDLGENRWQTLVGAHEAFRRVYEEHVATPLRESQMFRPELQQKIDENVWYATFVALRGLPESGIERLIDQSIGGNVGPQIYRQTGFLGEIKNPATATVLKALSLISAEARNRAKVETVAMLREMDPDNIRPADQRWTGKRMEYVPRETDKVGTVVYLREGKPQAYYVRKVVADALNKSGTVDNVLLAAGVKASGWLKGLFTQLNYAFWPVNYVRDTAGWMMQMPGVGTPIGYAKSVGRALAAARASVAGRKANRYAEEALRRRMVISKGDPRGVQAAAENEYDLKLASYGLEPALWDREARGVNTLVKAWNRYRSAGQVLERVNKIAGMIYLDERFPSMPEWKKREIVRERAGSPNFLERGALNPAIDFVALFYNPWKQGIRSVAKAARENPYSFAAKATAGVMLPTVIQAAAVNGWMGDDAKRKYRSIPDYDLTNYLVIPLGWVDKAQGKVAYLRLPLWEPARMGHGLLFQTLTERGQGLASFAGGQLPSLNPLLSVAAAWAQYEMFGHNPYDALRGQGVLTDTQFTAGGAPALEALGKWTWNQLGGSIFHRFQNLQLEDPPAAEMEQMLRLPMVNNALGRWVKVSSRGLADEARQLTEPVAKQQAMTRLAVNEIARKVLAGEALVESERVLLRDPYALSYLRERMRTIQRSRSSPDQRNLERAGSRAEKQAIVEGRQ